MPIKNNHRLQIGLAMSGHAVTDLYSSFIIGIIPILAIKFNLSLFLVGILTAIAGISNSLTQPIFGYLSDKYSPKYFMLSLIHISEPTRRTPISYAVFCLKKK